MDLRKKTATFSLYNINGLVFITELESVYCSVRSESLHITQILFVLKWLQYLSLAKGNTIVDTRPINVYYVPTCAQISSVNLN